MDFLKKHYEKILLSLVLLGLVGAAYWLNKSISSAQGESPLANQVPPKNRPVPALDLTPERQALQTVTNTTPLEFSGAHNLFNPVTWKRKSDGSLMKVLVEGPDAITITNIKPLYVTINYDSASGSGYYLTVSFDSGRRVPREFAHINEKAKCGLFTLREVKGAPEDPSELVLELAANQELVSVSKSNACQRVDGYIADFKYEPDNKTFIKQKVGDSFVISGAAYKIVAISSNEVRVVSNTTRKQSTIKWIGAPVPQ